MSINVQHGIAPLALHQDPGIQEMLRPPEVRTGNHTPVGGQGGLAGRTISVGNGEQRDTTVTAGDKAKNFFKAIGKGLAALVAAPIALGLGIAAAGLWLGVKAINFIPRMVNDHILEPRAEARFKAENAAMLGALSTPMQGSVLEKEGVVAKLMAHAQATGKTISEQEMRDLVSSGERISKALYAAGGDARPLSVTVGDDTHQVNAGTYTARACSWYMMAQAASQDVDRAALQDNPQTSDMVTEGSFIMKDPGNRMYNFLNSAPTATSRMSSHFNERLGHTETHKAMGFIPTGKPSHRGIEDYQNKMPGSGGTMLFDKLRPGEDGNEELYVKFEHGGCPPYFKTESHEGFGHGFARFFSALDRNLGHSVDFVRTRFSGPKETDVVRQEHVYKGALKDTINAGFKTLVKNAIDAGVINADAGAVGKSVNKFGLPYVQDAIATIQRAARETGNADLARQASELVDLVARETTRLGYVSDQHGIERRGAEVHISIT